jgi:hypothetical protein
MTRNDNAVLDQSTQQRMFPFLVFDLQSRQLERRTTSPEKQSSYSPLGD